MAITTLPYPNMDFVPLDVLTADELDQIVANIDAINNASIPTDSIADGSVTSDKINWTTFGIANYSTSEVATGATWIDGRTIYKKTINFGSMPNNATKSVPHGISNLGMMVKIEGIAWYSTGVGFWIPFGSPVDVSNSVAVNTDMTLVTMRTGSDRSSANAYITLYYVKTV